MGWGKKTAGAKPQPSAPLDPQGNTAILKRHIMLSTSMGAEQAEEKARTLTGEHEALPEKPTDAAKAQIDWHQLKSKKGWTDPTLVMLMYEFIQSKGLFADLVKFTRRR